MTKLDFQKGHMSDQVI